MKARRTPFYRWLMLSVERDTPRGDLARDARADFGVGWDGSLKGLARCTDDTAAEETFKRARSAYRVQRELRGGLPT